MLINAGGHLRGGQHFATAPPAAPSKAVTPTTTPPPWPDAHGPTGRRVHVEHLLEGNDFKEYVEERRGKGSGPELLVTKSVNSASYGTPNLDDWFKASGVTQVVLAGIQTNMCVETTARMGGNLGDDVLVALDATHTFGLTGPNGWHLTADELARASAVSLHGGGFARVVTTGELVAVVRP
ncbi:isochorismatase family protein [Streptomyces decoyicus]|uniref:isochorismatase family protein n=1 Tax=Streptomyces decoyicus TaxID=249567 RepID=UPI00363BBC71